MNPAWITRATDRWIAIDDHSDVQRTYPHAFATGHWEETRVYDLRATMMCFVCAGWAHRRRHKRKPRTKIFFRMSWMDWFVWCEL